MNQQLTKRKASAKRELAETNLVYVKYLDHVLFRNSDPELYKPTVREAVGWLHSEDEECIRICWDRSVKPLPNELASPTASGLVLLKIDVLELRRLS